MLTLPITLVVALILGFLALRYMLAADRSGLFLGLLAACAGQSLIISLAHHYGVTWLSGVQPFTATLAPVLAWLSFQSAAMRPPSLARDWIHIAGPALVGVSMLIVPVALDIVLPAVFIVYGAAILILLRRDETLSRVRLASGPLPARIWTMMAVLLLLSALSDILIAVALGLGHTELRPIIVSISTSMSLLGIGLLSLSPHVEAQGEADSPVEPPPTEEEVRLIARLDAHMRHARPFLDPDLTLSRLARQLHVPVKQLSAAINRHKGENVSRYVNRFRVEDACDRLRAGESVTEAMLASGFNTKSNFNREFLRVAGQSPTAFVASQAG